MKVLGALCFVAAVAQAIATDWIKLDETQVLPPNIARLLEERWKDQQPLESRIAGGEVVPPGQFQHHVRILADNGNTEGVRLCAASILSETLALTAASCVAGATNVVGVYGTHSLLIDDPNKSRFIVESVAISDNSNLGTSGKAIALLRLPKDKPMQLNGTAASIRVQSKQLGTTWEGQTGSIPGFGVGSATSTDVSNVLLSMSGPIMDNGACNAFCLGTVEPNEMCVSGYGGHSPCKGDYGGGLVVVESDGKPTLVAVSHGYQVPGILCNRCGFGFPSRYTRIAPYLDWILKNANITQSGSIAD